MAEAWMAADHAGVLIGCAGSACVLLCACFGGLSRFLARQGVGRVPVIAGFVVLTGLGLGVGGFAAVAAASDQPAYLWCSAASLAIAVLGTVALGLPGIIARYRRAAQRQELQRLADQLLPGTSSRLLTRIEHARRWR